MGGIVKPEEASSFSFVFFYAHCDNYLQFDYFYEVLPERCFLFWNMV